jgi:glutathione S-transferase
MADATLIISSKNYSSWSLRGFLLARLAGLDFVEDMVAFDDPRAKEELLMRTSSILWPCLIHGDVKVWDTMAIAEYLNETFPEAQLYPAERQARARARSISGEMHSGFTALRSSLPMNIRFHKSGFTVWSSAQADIDRITHVWRDCLQTWHGPFLFGDRPGIADAMYAPVVLRFQSYDVSVDSISQAYCETILNWGPVAEWVEAARREPQEIIELDLDF